jgi:hypothetical protein
VTSHWRCLMEEIEQRTLLRPSRGNDARARPLPP